MHADDVQSASWLKKPREHLVEIDDDLGTRDLPSDAIAHDATLAFTGAYFDGLGAQVDEPDLPKSKRKISVALELAIINPR